MTKSILGWSCAVILCGLYGSWLSAYAFLRFFQDRLIYSPIILFFAVLGTFLGFGLVFTLLLTRVCRRRGFDNSGYWRSALIATLLIPIAAMLVDSPPIEADYESKDVVTTDPLILDSYETLMLLGRDGGLALETEITTELYRDIQTNAIAHSELIYRAWDSISEARLIIDTLATYTGITGLTPHVVLNRSTPPLNFVTLRSIALTYVAYALLKAEEGNPDEGLQQLATLHGVARKALPHTVMLVPRMIWIAIASANIETAFSILQTSQCTSHTLKELAHAFPAIPGDDISLTRVVIGEYVILKALIEADLDATAFIGTLSMLKGERPQRGAGLLRKTASSLVYHPMFRKNRTIRDLREHFDLLIDGAGKRPPNMMDADEFADYYRRNPSIRNMAGCYLVSYALPQIARAAEASSNTKVRSDLLAIEIGDRLNEPVVLLDYYSGDEYKRDVHTGQAFSVGPDMEPYTHDDIMLGKK